MGQLAFQPKFDVAYPLNFLNRPGGNKPSLCGGVNFLRRQGQPTPQNFRLCTGARAARQAAQQLGSRAQVRCARRAFSAWRIANASLQHQRSSLLSLCTELAAEQRLSAAFIAWHGVACLREQAVREALESFAARQQRRLLRQAFAAWRIANAALAHEQRQSAELMMAQRGQRTQRMGFLAWRRYAGHVRTAWEAATAMGLARQKQRQSERLRQVIRAWKRHAGECARQRLAEAALTRSVPKHAALFLHSHADHKLLEHHDMVHLT